MEWIAIIINNIILLLGVNPWELKKNFKIWNGIIITIIIYYYYYDNY